MSESGAHLVRPGARLGVDVGSVRIGLAASDPDALVAVPVRTVRRDPAGVTDTTEVAREAEDRGVVEVVVGLPLSMDGVERAAAQTARTWAVALARRVPGVAVRLVDERLSTVDAQRALHAAGRTTRSSRQVIDQQAAVSILQAALDSERLSGHAPGEIVGGRKPRARQSRRRPAEGQSG